MTEEQKEKYANFLDKVSEILGLNKPVDILRLCAVTDEYLRPIEKCITELEKENAELKERHAEILEAFASASSGDDFEMAESAREIMEILNIPCYRHGKVVSKLTKAKGLLKKIEKIVYSGENEIKRLSQIVDILAEAEQFLNSEVEK